MNAPVKHNAMVQTALFQSWIDAKRNEEAARAQRLEVEAQIVAMVGVKDEGVTSVEVDQFNVKTTGKVTRSVDTQAVQDVWEVLPDEVKKCFTWEAKLNTKEFRHLCSMREDLAPHLNKYITSKPAKPSISIELKDA